MKDPNTPQVDVAPVEQIAEMRGYRRDVQPVDVSLRRLKPHVRPVRHYEANEDAHAEKLDGRARSGQQDQCSAPKPTEEGVPGGYDKEGRYGLQVAGPPCRP